MRNFLCFTALSLALFYAGAAQAGQAASPAGDWLVKDKTAHMRVADCSGKFWGVISWAQNPGTDEHNPDPALRSRSVLGMPILLGMQANDKGGWSGDIYNADNGKIYHGSIALKSDNVLHIEGCLFGIFCGGEDWTRLSDAPATSDAQHICAHR